MNIPTKLAPNLVGRSARTPSQLEIEQIFGEPKIVVAPTPLVCESYTDRIVLVTGAAGSIGSELCRQLSALKVSCLLLLDHAENSLFEFERELRDYAPNTEIVSILGDVRDRNLLDDLFARYMPHIVLHSAAYKHVAMMEAHPSEGFLNNVIGTRNVLDSTLEFRCERFVLISSDKAVNPSSVMGATKRLAEMLVKSRAEWSAEAGLACVRFGNVIGSRGSVIPIFLKQIAERKPLTLTDERMRRYFVTVAEAVQLVLQASTLASSGEIYVLDMGDPFFISTVARKLIELSGLEPEDIPVEIFGIRPGEKLEEELWSEDSVVAKTRLPGVFRIDEGDAPSGFEEDLLELEELARARRDHDLLEKLRTMPIGYGKQNELTASAGDD